MSQPEQKIEMSVGVDVNVNVALPPLSAYVYQMADERLQHAVEGHHITKDNIFILVTLAMQIAEDIHRMAQVPKLKGEEKKKLVTKLVADWVAKNTDMDDEDRRIVQEKIIPNSLSGLIDSFCMLALNNVKKGLLAGLVACCCSMLPEERQLRRIKF